MDKEVVSKHYVEAMHAYVVELLHVRLVVQMGFISKKVD